MSNLAYKQSPTKAAEVAQDIMNNGSGNFDWTDWHTLNESDKANAFDELVSLIANLKADRALTHTENCAEYYREISSSIEKSFEIWANREALFLGQRGLFTA